MKTRLLILFQLFPLLSLVTHSQSIEHYNFKTITVNDNLSHSDINAIVQDIDGYSWIATNNGLNRYDGYEIVTFKSSIDEPNSMPGNRISQMVADDEGFFGLYLRHNNNYDIEHPERFKEKSIKN